MITSLYLNIIEIIYNKVFSPSKLTEGQDLSNDELSSDDFAILALDKRIENIVNLIKKNYKKHDKMKESKKKINYLQNYYNGKQMLIT